MARLTLAPLGVSSAGHGFFCLLCGYRGTADVLVNIVLFAPLGILGAQRWPWRNVVAVGVLVTCGIELAQLMIPGRYPSLQDLLANSAGAAGGAWLAGNHFRLRPWWLPTAVGLGLWLAPVFLLVPRSPEPVVFQKWSASLGHSGQYLGTIRESVYGDTRHTEPWDATVPSEWVRDRSPFSLEVDHRPAGSSLSPIFTLVDRAQREILLLAAIGDDLVLRGYTWARALGFDQPDHRWPGALTDVSSETVRVTVERGEASGCIRLSGVRRCRLAPGLGDGWAFFLNLEGAGGWLRLFLSVGWALGVGAVATYQARSLREAGVIGLLGALCGLAVSASSPDLRPDVGHAGLLVIGALAGHLAMANFTVTPADTISTSAAR